MSDRLYLSGLTLLALAMIALALVWPQATGARSPPPFGHEPAPPAQARGPAETPSLLPGLPSSVPGGGL